MTYKIEKNIKIALKIPNLRKHMDICVQDAHRTLNREDQQRCRSMHITVRLPTSIAERFLKVPKSRVRVISLK